MGRIGDIVRNCDGLISRHAKGSDSLEDRVGISPHKVRELLKAHNKNNYVVKEVAFTSKKSIFKSDSLLKPTFTCKTKQPKKPIRKKRVKFIKKRKLYQSMIDSTTFTCSRKILTERKSKSTHLNYVKKLQFSHTLIAQGLDSLRIGGEMLVLRVHAASVCSYGYKVGKKFCTKKSESLEFYCVATRIS